MLAPFIIYTSLPSQVRVRVLEHGVSDRQAMWILRVTLTRSSYRTTLHRSKELTRNDQPFIRWRLRPVWAVGHDERTPEYSFQSPDPASLGKLDPPSMLIEKLLLCNGVILSFRGERRRQLESRCG